MSRVILVSLFALALVAFGFAVPSVAQDPGEVPAGYLTGFHIVRPYESLRRITRNYLGSEQLWETNWRLNPDVEDPDYLLPGQRLRVLVRPEDSVPSAQVVGISGTVQERPDPIAWTPAQRLDLMVESDGIQTATESSTALRFHDGTRLVLTEDSIVFLKVAGRTLRGIETRSVEIVEGQADLAGEDVAADSPQIEIVIGEATAKPKKGSARSAEARLRKSETGAAQVMVFEGEGEVEAAGQSVSVAQGMGTSVPAGQAPLPPEKLLPSPALSSPGADGSLEAGQLDFSWEAVEGADRYVVEVCADSLCESLVTRATDVGSTRWKAAELPMEGLHWRVTAVSPSGLDGYPSPTQSFSVVPLRAEFDPPAAVYRLVARSVERTVEGERRTFYAPTARVRVEVEDPSDVVSWQPVIDGEASAPADLEGGWSHGDHTVAITAEDGLGNRGQAEEVLSFTVDSHGPELSWRVGGREVLEEMFGRGTLELPQSGRWFDRGAERNARRVRKRRPPEWTLIAWGNHAVPSQRTLESGSWIEGLYESYRALRLTGTEPVAVIFAPGIIDDSPAQGRTSGSLLILQCRDAAAGVEDLTVATVGSQKEGYRLRTRCRDRLDNVSSRTWSFASPAR